MRIWRSGTFGSPSSFLRSVRSRKSEETGFPAEGLIGRRGWNEIWGNRAHQQYMLLGSQDKAFFKHASLFQAFKCQPITCLVEDIICSRAAIMYKGRVSWMRRCKYEWWNSISVGEKAECLARKFVHNPPRLKSGLMLDHGDMDSSSNLLIIWKYKEDERDHL